MQPLHACSTRPDQVKLEAGVMQPYSRCSLVKPYFHVIADYIDYRDTASRVSAVKAIVLQDTHHALVA